MFAKLITGVEANFKQGDCQNLQTGHVGNVTMILSLLKLEKFQTV